MNISVLENLIDQLHHLPGIGRKTAQRLAFFIIKEPEEDVQTFVIPEPEPRTDLRIGAALERVENNNEARWLERSLKKSRGKRIKWLVKNRIKE